MPTWVSGHFDARKCKQALTFINFHFFKLELVWLQATEGIVCWNRFSHKHPVYKMAEHLAVFFVCSRVAQVTSFAFALYLCRRARWALCRLGPLSSGPAVVWARCRLGPLRYAPSVCHRARACTRSSWVVTRRSEPSPPGCTSRRRWTRPKYSRTRPKCSRARPRRSRWRCRGAGLARSWRRHRPLRKWVLRPYFIYNIYEIIMRMSASASAVSNTLCKVLFQKKMGGKAKMQ